MNMSRVGRGQCEGCIILLLSSPLKNPLCKGSSQKAFWFQSFKNRKSRKCEKFLKSKSKIVNYSSAWQTKVEPVQPCNQNHLTKKGTMLLNKFKDAKKDFNNNYKEL